MPKIHFKYKYLTIFLQIKNSGHRMHKKELTRNRKVKKYVG